MRTKIVICILALVVVISTSSAFAAQTIASVLDVTGTGDNVIRLDDQGGIGWTNGTTTNYQMWEDNTANRYFHIGRAGVGQDLSIANGDVLMNPGHKLYFDGAYSPGNTYVTQNAPNALSFVTGGTERMQVSSFVDISGTGDNVIRLDDQGGIGWTNGTTTNYQMWEDNTANRYFHIGRAHVGPEVTIANGNVGIGTISPLEKLDIYGNMRLTGNITSSKDICIGTC